MDVQDPSGKGPDDSPGDQAEIAGQKDRFDSMFAENPQSLTPDLVQGPPLHRHHGGGDTGPPGPFQGSGIGPVTYEEPDSSRVVVGFVVQEGLEVASAAGSEYRNGDAHLCLQTARGSWLLGRREQATPPNRHLCVLRQLPSVVTHQEGVGLSLPAYRGLGPVAREESGLVR